MASVQYPLIKDLAPGAVTGDEIDLAPLRLNLDYGQGRRIELGDDTVARRIDFYLDATYDAIVFEPPPADPACDFWIGYNRNPQNVYIYSDQTMYFHTVDASGVGITNGGNATLNATAGDVRLTPQTAGKQVILGSSANGVRVAKEGVLTLTGTGRVKNHFRIDPERLTLPAANFPALGLKGVFPTLDYDKTTEESAYLSDYVPFRKDSVSDIAIDGITWCCDTETAGAVVWGVEYRSIETGEVVDGATTTITQAQTTNATAGNMNNCVFTTGILAANIASNDDIGIRIFRKAADGADTLDEDARLLGIHLHFITDKLGEAV